jgi:AraC-like DNA-binding protein
VPCAPLVTRIHSDFSAPLTLAVLASTDRPISDIAEDVGYGSDIAFSRAYKRRFGVSPSAARYSP